MSRRQLVQLGSLTGLTLLIGAAAGSLRVALPGIFTAAATPTPTARPPTPTPSPTSSSSPASSSPGSTPTATALGKGIPISTVAAVQRQGFVEFTVPAAAPAALFPTDPAIVIGLADGTFAAYDLICTHEGCVVDYDPQSTTLFCPCHGAEFDPASHAQVLQGPARRPLPELPLAIDSATGTISLAVS